MTNGSDIDNINQEREIVTQEVHVDILNQAALSDSSVESERTTEDDDITEELRHWAVESNIHQIHLDKLLKILRKKLIPSLPKSSKTFLKSNSGTYCITEMEDADMIDTCGQFVYFGIEKGLQRCINPEIHEGLIELIFNVDGLPVSESSGKSFWPILCKAHHIPDIYSPFPVAIYFGMSKPKHVDAYLRQFVQEINDLNKNGVVISGKRYEVKLKCFVADTPARAFLKCCKCHGGYSACERCVVHGKSEKTGKGQTVVYPGVNHEQRTNETFRKQTDAQHHTGTSPLLDIKPPVDMVSICLLDVMHLVSGLLKRLIVYWMKGSSKKRVKASSKKRTKNSRKKGQLSPTQKTEVSRRLLSLQSQIPCEFQRKPRPIHKVLKWKATEFRFFLLYCGPIVLKSILPSNLYQHFMLLHVAFRILCSDELAISSNALAEKCLKKFVLASPLLYGPASVPINIHNLVHVADDARNMGCNLSRINCFPFESALGALKKKLRTRNKPLAQICRRYQEQDSVKKQRPSLPPILEVCNSFAVNGITIVRSLKFQSVFLSCAMPNNMVLLKDGNIMQLDKIWNEGESTESMMIQGNLWKDKNSVYDYPLNSKRFGMWELRESSAVLGTYFITEVKQKLVRLQLSFRHSGPERLFVISMLHT